MKTNYLCLIITIIIFGACNEDDQMDPIECLPSATCSWDEYLTPAVNSDTSYFLNCATSIIEYGVGFYARFPVFNPTNNNEFAYMRNDPQEFTGCVTQLWHFNICTGENYYLDDIFCGGELDYSSSGWIAYTGTDHQIWKIKSSGDSLARLTNGGFNTKPIWKTDATELIFIKNTNNKNSYLQTDENGLVLDTLPEFLSSGSGIYDWSSDDKLIYIISNGNPFEIPPDLMYHDLNTGQNHLIEALTNEEGTFEVLNHVNWTSDNSAVIWIGPKEIAKTDIQTGERNYLINVIPYNPYGFPDVGASISPDNERYIFSRKEWSPTADIICTADVTYDIYSINLNGPLNESKILIPE